MHEVLTGQLRSYDRRHRHRRRHAHRNKVRPLWSVACALPHFLLHVSLHVRHVSLSDNLRDQLYRKTFYRPKNRIRLTGICLTGTRPVTNTCLPVATDLNYTWEFIHI